MRVSTVLAVGEWGPKEGCVNSCFMYLCTTTLSPPPPPPLPCPVVAALAVAPARATFMAPTKNTTQILTALNATKTAVASEVELKMLAGVTKDTTLARFTGAVTCYLDDATGDVVGLQFGSADPLCTNAGTTRSFTVPADGYISSMKVAVDPKTDWVGQVAFVVKSNSSLVPTNIVTCGSRGAVGVDVMPKLTALASVSGACRPASAAGRRLAQSTVGLDPASLKVTVTSIAAPGGGGSAPGPLVSCVKTVTDQLLLAASPFSVPVQLMVTAVGAGGGAGGNSACGGGGGSSAVVVSRGEVSTKRAVHGGGQRGRNVCARAFPTLCPPPPPLFFPSRSTMPPRSPRPEAPAAAMTPPTPRPASPAPRSRSPRRCRRARRCPCTSGAAARPATMAAAAPAPASLAAAAAARTQARRRFAPVSGEKRKGKQQRGASDDGVGGWGGASKQAREPFFF